MTSTLRQLQQCPECHNEYDTRETLKRYPTSCRWCFFTICCSCVEKAPKPKQAKVYGISCRKCGKGGAFPLTTKPLVHQFSCRLLEQLRRLQNQLEQQQQPSSSLAVHPSRLRSVSDSEEPEILGQINNNNNPPQLLQCLSPQKKEEEVFPTGTCLYDGKRWGRIQSSHTTPQYALQYGDGDPEWVGYQEMINVLQAAEVKLNNGSEAFLCHNPDDDAEDFLGRDVLREFPHMGWYWGKVVQCNKFKRTYTVDFEGRKDGLVKSPQQVKQWVVAATRQKDSRSNLKRPPPPTQQQHESAPTKKARILNKDPVSSLEGAAKITRRQQKPRNKEASDKAKPENEIITIDDDFKLSIRAKGTGWNGFDRYLSDSMLPSKFKDVLELMDVLFPVVEGEHSFCFALWQNSFNVGQRHGQQVKDTLWRIKKKDNSFLPWHKKGSHYAPKSKADLAEFIEILMNLNIAPKLKSNPTNRRRKETAITVSKSKKKKTRDL